MGLGLRTLVVIPTYNEIESLPRQIEGVRTHTPNVDILVADDSSPDGTGEWAAKQAKRDQHINVLHRTSKEGLGAAYLDAFAWGLKHDYDVIVEMDADGSHQASQLQSLLDRVGEQGLVIGSRWMKGGSVVNWPWHRELLSRGANLYVRIALGLKVKDSTAGFRAYTAQTLKALDLTEVATQGYGFQVDMTWRTKRAGVTIAEVPIEFVERTHGQSKMSGFIVREAFTSVAKWAIAYRWGQFVGLFRRSGADSTGA